MNPTDAAKRIMELSGLHRTIRLDSTDNEIIDLAPIVATALLELLEAFEPCKNGHGLQAECYGCQRDAARKENESLRARIAELEKT